MVEEKTIRLSQVARKLNVATTTITAYLLEKGFKIENKPNTKITLEQYNLLAKEFAGSAMDKEEAAELVIGHSYEVGSSPEKETKNVTKQEQPGVEKPTTIEPESIKPVQPIVVESQPVIEPPTLEPEIPLAEDKEDKTESIEEKPIEKVEVEDVAPTTIKGPIKITLTNQEEFKGVTVLGKIDLGEKVVKKFQQVASSDLEKKNKKRPRKRVDNKPESPLLPR